jgi:hypothetical protein
MSRILKKDETRRLLDHLAGPTELGTPEALFATTFDLNPSFVELDFLPTVLGVSTWDDRSAKGRIELEQQLARIETVALAMEGRRLQGRPQSLRVHLTPSTMDGGGVLHAKVCLIVHEDAVRLLVSSANLTEDGYRHNREVAMAIVGSAKRRGEARLIADALAPMSELLKPWWNDTIESCVRAARIKLTEWQQTEALEDEQVVWSGLGRPLWREFLKFWPEGEPVKEIHIVSPFWSPERGQGPIGQLLQGLREHGAELNKTVVRLTTAAERDTVNHFCPSLPEGFATFDFRTLGVRVEAAAALPKVDPEDVGGNELVSERQLHAKAVLIVGSKTSLAYVGSANFTVAGWGFGNGESANVEAGVAMRRRGKARDALRAILPETDTSVLLDGNQIGVVLTTREEDGDERPFPKFLRGVELCPTQSEDERLELVVNLREGDYPAFTLELSYGDGDTPLNMLTVSAGNSAEPIQVGLDADTLRELLRQRVVLVAWHEGGQKFRAEFPINVSVEAREQLPFCDASLLPREGDLIAFYQGRIAFSDVFRSAYADDEADVVDASAASESAVDTSQILSYQVREFVDALPGIRQELSRSISTVPNIRLAFLGPISPLALAREIEKTVSKGRSTTAVAFQFVELLACVLEARPETELTERLSIAWKTAVREVAAEIGQMYERLKVSDLNLASNESFRCYEQSLLCGHRGVQ